MMSETTGSNIDSATLLDLTARIVSAYAGNATLTPTGLTDVIGSVSRALSSLSSTAVEVCSAECFSECEDAEIEIEVGRIHGRWCHEFCACYGFGRL